MQQLKSAFKKTINCNKYQSKVSVERQDHHLDYLIDPSFQVVNRVSGLSFEESAHRTRHTGYFPPKEETNIRML